MLGFHADEKLHAEASLKMHESLQGTKSGMEMSNFISQTCASRLAESNETAITKVFNLTKALITTINMENGLERTGFLDDRRALPKFMIVADLMGKRVSAWSDKPTLIRELCASFYGSENAGFGNGCVLRHEIDNEVKSAALQQEPTSLCLVLVQNWGESISDRFWRLSTIKCVDVCTFRDSERVLTSMQAPPARPACSVLGAQMTETVSAKVVDEFCNDWKASNLESSGGGGGGGGSSGGSSDGDGDGGGGTGTSGGDEVDVAERGAIEGRQLVVLKSLLNQLRGENRRLQTALDALKQSKEAEILSRVSVCIKAERELFYTDIEELHRSLEAHAIHTSTERVRAEALEREIKNTDIDLAMSLAVVHELRGEVLVEQETIVSTKQQKADEIDKLKELLRQARVDVKRVEAARKQEAEQRISEKAKRLVIDGKLEDQRLANETLNSALRKSNDRERSFRETTSEQTGHLVDMNQSHTLAIKKLNMRVLELCAVTSTLREEHASALCRERLVHRIAARFRCKLKTRVDATRLRARPAPLDEAVDKPPSPNAVEALHFPADAVASANASISMLRRFIEKASETTGGRSVVSPQGGVRYEPYVHSEPSWYSPSQLQQQQQQWMYTQQPMPHPAHHYHHHHQQQQQRQQQQQQQFAVYGA